MVDWNSRKLFYLLVCLADGVFFHKIIVTTSTVKYIPAVIVWKYTKSVPFMISFFETILAKIRMIIDWTIITYKNWIFIKNYLSYNLLIGTNTRKVLQTSLKKVVSEKLNNQIFHMWLILSLPNCLTEKKILRFNHLRQPFNLNLIWFLMLSFKDVVILQYPSIRFLFL